MTTPDATTDDAPSRARSTIDLDHDVDDVWAALTDSAGLAKWMGEGSTIEPWPGGEVTVADIADGRPKHGRVTGIQPQRELELDWWPTDDPDEVSQVAFTLVSVEGGTRLTVTETAPRALASATSGSVAAVGAWRLALVAAALPLSLAAATGPSARMPTARMR